MQKHITTHVTLIGMPGVGKSTLGWYLAKQKGYDFLDTDILIQEQTGLPLQHIIDHQGETAFMHIESQTIQALCLKRSTVISPGGSVVYSPEAMTYLKKISTIIYLKDTFPKIQMRIPNLKTRGIIGLKGKTLQGLFKEREGLYQTYADITVEMTGKKTSEIKKELERVCP